MIEKADLDAAIGEMTDRLDRLIELQTTANVYLDGAVRTAISTSEKVLLIAQGMTQIAPLLASMKGIGTSPSAPPPSSPPPAGNPFAPGTGTGAGASNPFAPSATPGSGGASNPFGVPLGGAAGSNPFGGAGGLGGAGGMFGALLPLLGGLNFDDNEDEDRGGNVRPCGPCGGGCCGGCGHGCCGGGCGGCGRGCCRTFGIDPKVQKAYAKALKSIKGILEDDI